MAKGPSVAKVYRGSLVWVWSLTLESMQLMTKHGVDDGDDCISRVPLPQMCSHK